ncbi:hypothetical protein BDK51DRAFT_40718 [Blyttiomyces helicus]|uniref:Calponin-homology (CH) domain-containing protein n=1 Tax=Blyttiomyces helicus TaxID=388810 RepID=A0A4P9WNC4_9FUNG|nr:hypothetical protein BDK51DRAFT_40718 [Blyttiomyces helicus]|eukprot:RKO93573.1 hypothetical protein BDK51DRAFT_40718 [Blyttiomyces helicus]
MSASTAQAPAASPSNPATPEPTTTTKPATKLPRSGSGLPQTVHVSDVKVDAKHLPLKAAIISWIASILNMPDATKDENATWNDLRYGDVLCKLMNIVSPGAVGHISAERSVPAAVENLTAFSNGG